MSFQPEIKDDELFHAMVAQIERIKPRTAIEIGSANGLGSTQAFIQGIEKSGEPCELFCFELDTLRCADLATNVAGKSYVHVLNKSPLLEAMTHAEVLKFLGDHPDMNPAQYGAETVLSWLDAINRQMNFKPWDGLDSIADRIQAPCIALVDGSPFSGLQEAQWLAEHGVYLIILDDTEDIKCYDAYRFLQHAGYRAIAENPILRNGYAIFEKEAM